MQKHVTDKHIDAISILVLIIIALFYGFISAGTFFGKPIIVCLVFMVPPLVYLGLREKKNWRKILTATILFGIIFAFPFDFIAEYTKSWTVTNLVIPWKILGIDPIDNIIGYISFTALTITFYQHFIERDRKKTLSPNVKYGFIFGAIIILILFLIYFFDPSILLLEYPYFTLGIIALIPLVIFGFVKPQYIKNMATIFIYFFLLYFAFEYVAVKNNYWIYTGNNYVGWVDVFGITFPFEELFFWMMLYAPALVSYYKIFVDDYYSR